MIKTNVQQFNAEVMAFEKKVPAMVVTFQKAIVAKALQLIVDKTPVVSGHAQRNWNVRALIPDKNVQTKVDLSFVGEELEIIARGVNALVGLKPFVQVFISNSVKYIEVLESGSSKQAPHGMVAVSIEELRLIFDAVK